MRKIIYSICMILIGFFINGCCNSRITINTEPMDNRIVQASSDKDQFVVTHKESLGGWKRLLIIKDTSTGIEYIYVHNSEGVGITPRLTKQP